MSVVLACVCLLAAESSAVLDAVAEGLVKEIGAIQQPLLETVVDLASKQCDTIKELFGLDYDEMKNSGAEPDVNMLTLKYITKTHNISLNINSAAELLPKTPDFNSEHFIIFVHGFTADPGQKSFASISNGFITRGMNNVLALDGSPLIRWFYLRSTTYVRFMGQKLGNILANLVKEGLPSSSIHLVGHSLGAHISGFTGKQFLAATGRRVGRISGLDPAGPCFSQLEPALKLSPDDADFVDVIHSNAGVAGLKEPVGHVDFYPNEGSQQPNCLLAPCHHGRAWEYFAESLRDEDAFPAMRCQSWDEFKKDECDNCNYMGIACRKDPKGIFYLQTAGSAPYGLGENGTYFANNEAIFKSIIG